MKSLKVLLACLVDDYRDPGKGFSFEYHHLYLPLKEISGEVILFDFLTIEREQGRDAMNRQLADVVRNERPDVSIFALFKDNFLPEVIEGLRAHTTTVAYFFDDMWRRDYFRFWAPRFDYATTSLYSTLRRYRVEGRPNVIPSPFAYSDDMCRRKALPKRYDVTFVGGGHPWRQFIVRHLQKAGIDVQAFGPFWPAGRLSDEAMVDVFSQSRVNLNISNSRHWDLRYVLSSYRALRTTLRSPKDREQIKARHFEIAGCGGFQLTYYCEDLERHFVIGDEVAVYLDPDDLVDKVRFYLAHDEERERIAAAGYERARRDHTAGRRLTDLLAAVTSGARTPRGC